MKFNTFAALAYVSLAILCIGLAQEMGSISMYAIIGFALSLYLIPLYTGVK